MNIDYHPALFGLKHIKLWWIIPIFAVLGAIAGLLFTFILPPTYEAIFTLTTNFEIDPTEEITELMLDGAINHVGELVFNQEVLYHLIAQEAANGNNITSEQLKQITTVERKLTSTLIKVRWHDPVIAARIANTWGLSLYNRLQNAYEQSLVSDSLSDYQDSMESCMLQTEGSYTKEPCFGMDQDQLEETLTELSVKISEARDLSLGLHPFLYVNHYVEADVPAKPLFYSKNLLILAGGAIGLITSVIILEIKNSVGANKTK